MSDDLELTYLDTAIPWWQSRGIIGSLVTIVASLIGLAGWQMDVGQATELALGLASLIGGGLSWWGRVRAHPLPISRNQVLPGITRESEAKKAAGE